MGYEIKETLLPVGTNRPGTKLYPVGVVIHETATPNATDEAEYNYFCGGNRNASAHYFVDYDSISRLIPENEISWHAGATANKQFIGIEICHFDDEDKFQEIWKRGTWLVADMCKRYGWNPDDVIHSHHWCSLQWHESTHEDPDSYFASHGKTMDDFVSTVKELIDADATPKYDVYQGDTFLNKFANYSDAVEEAKKWSNSSVREIETGNWVWSNYEETPVKKYYNIFVNGVEEDYDTSEEAYKRGWELLSKGYKDVYVTEPDGGLYTFSKHPEENPYAYKLNVNGTIEVYYNEKEAYTRGWYLYNKGYTGVIMNDPDGVYTFDKHPSDNPQKASAPEPVASKGTAIKGAQEVVDGAGIDAYIKKYNPNAPDVGQAYVEVGAKLGIRGDIAVAQAILETGWFKSAKSANNNFCGLGAVNGGAVGAIFSTPTEGAIAHLQHLWAYISSESLPNGMKVIDPRFDLVQSLNKNAVYFEDLAGSWAVPGYDKTVYSSYEEAYKSNATYGQQILGIFESMKSSVGVSQPVEEQTTNNETVVEEKTSTVKKDIFYTVTNVEDSKIVSVVIDGKGYVRVTDIADKFNCKALFDTQTSEIIISDEGSLKKSYDTLDNKKTLNLDVFFTTARMGDLYTTAVIIDGKGYVRATAIARLFGYVAKYNIDAQELLFSK